MPKKTPAAAAAATTDKCQQGICGRYERIDPSQIVFSFKMPDVYEGTPTITLIAPGKSVDLNSIPNLRINRKPNVGLSDDPVLFMFGKRATSTLAITDLQLLNVTPGSTGVVALLTGTGFDTAKDSVFVNGTEMGVSAGTVKSFKSPNLYRLEFDLPAEETLKVTVLQDKEVVAKSFTNPAALKKRRRKTESRFV